MTLFALAQGTEPRSSSSILNALAMAGALPQSQVNQMYPTDVVKYWATGIGGNLYFGPDSKMSQMFSQGKGVNAFETYLFSKYKGNPPHLAEMTKFSYKLT